MKLPRRLVTLVLVRDEPGGPVDVDSIDGPEITLTVNGDELTIANGVGSLLGGNHHYTFDVPPSPYPYRVEARLLDADPPAENPKPSRPDGNLWGPNRSPIVDDVLHQISGRRMPPDATDDNCHTVTGLSGRAWCGKPNPALHTDRWQDATCPACIQIATDAQNFVIRNDP